MTDLEFRNRLMRKAGIIAADILQQVCAATKEGVSLIELDDLAESLCYQNDVSPAFKGYNGFPNTLWVGVNDIVVHGIPSDYQLQSGDIVSLDFGIEYKKVYSDTCYTVIIGKVNPAVEKFVKTVEESMYKGIAQAVTGNTIGDIGHAVQSTVEAQGYSVVRDMVGHGIGYELHEMPDVPNWGEPGKGPQLYEGQAIAVEAIINMGGPEIVFDLADGWTTRTKDSSLSGLFEHTVIVGKVPEILTKWR